MKIAFDAQLLFEKQKTGIGWTTKMLIDEMIKDQRYEYQLNCFNFRKNPERDSLIKEYREKGCIVKECKWIPAPVYNHLERIIPFPYRFIFGSDSDITQFFNYTLPFGVKGKRITIVYDMAYKAYPETVALKTKKWLESHLKSYCHRADIIITISEFSKSEIMQYLSIPSEKIRVVYSGVDLKQYKVQDDLEIIQNVKDRYHISGDYILYLGTLEPRKNIERILDAYMYLKREKGLVPQLVLAGKKGWLYDSIFKKVKEYGLQSDVLFTGYIAEEDTAALMSGAIMFVFPSLYEGFGIPPLEAMACGTPVIASNTTSLLEVVGDAGVLVNPLDVVEIKNGMKELIENSELRNRLIEKGLAHVQKFNWKLSAAKLLDIYYNIKTETMDANN